MLIVMDKNAAQGDFDRVIRTILAHGWEPKPIPGGERTAIGILRNQGAIDPAIFLGMPGVRDAILVSKPYKLVSREMHSENTTVSVGDGSVVIGGEKLVIMAGPCAVESEARAQVILCERGIRTFTRHSRNTLDLNAVPYIRKESHLPIVVGPSHASGRRDQVIPLARASAAVGANGLLVEVHTDPEQALSDGPQSLRPAEFEELVRGLRAMNIMV